MPRPEADRPAAPRAGPGPGLGSRALSALSWNYAGAAARTASGLILGILLARLLGPKPFGQAAAAALLLGLGNLLADVGLGSALIQNRRLHPDDIRFAFTLQSLFAAGLAGAVWLLAPAIGSFFQQRELVAVVRALLPVTVLQGMSQTATSLLRRDLRLKTIQAAQLASYLIGYGALGIPLACKGAGVWSLVAAQLGQSLAYGAIVYRSVRHPLTPMFRSRTGGMVGYGAKAASTNLANWAIGNLDNLFVGRVLGIANLGLYSRAFNLVAAPETSLVAALQAVLFPAYARSQDRREMLRRVYLAALGLVALLAIPPCAVVAATAPTWIRVGFGERWLAAAPVLTPLALAIPFDALMALASSLLWGLDRVGRELRIQAAVALVAVAILAVTTRISLAAVGWGVAALYLLRSLWLNRAAMNLLGLRWRDLGRAVRPSLLVAFPAALAAACVDRLGSATGMAVPARFALVLVSAVTIAMGLAIASAPLWTPEVRWAVGKLGESLAEAASAYRWLGRPRSPGRAIAGANPERRAAAE